MIRTFLAVTLPEPLKMSLARLQLDLKQRLSREFSHGVRVSWVQSTSLHLTIKFLGDINEELVLPMKESISGAVRDHQAFDVPLERLGVFPGRQQPRVLWVGPDEQWEQGEGGRRLAQLHQAIDECCSQLGLARDDRLLNAHLTLARIKEGERSVGQSLAKSGVMDRPLALGSLVVESVALMKSDLQPKGPVYTKLWELRLGG